MQTVDEINLVWSKMNSLIEQSNALNGDRLAEESQDSKEDSYLAPSLYDGNVPGYLGDVKTDDLMTGFYNIKPPLATPSKPQQPVIAPSSIQSLDTASNAIPKSVVAPSHAQPLGASPNTIEAPITTPSSTQIPVAIPSSTQTPVTAPSNIQQPKVTLKDFLQPVDVPNANRKSTSAFDNIQPPIVAPSSVQVPLAATPDIQPLDISPNGHQQPVSALDNTQHPVAAPLDIQPLDTALGDIQYLDTAFDSTQPLEIAFNSIPSDPQLIAPLDYIRESSIETEEADNVESEFTNDIEFDVKRKGYDRFQVDHYIDSLTEEYNAICRQCAGLEYENEGLRQALAALQVKRGSQIWALQ
jgi:hypothetical protein